MHRLVILGTAAAPDLVIHARHSAGSIHLEMMRLNRFLASAGLGSRRSCEELIRSGQVTINGVLCDNLATQIAPTDVVKVGNRVLRSAAPMTLLLHKPAGFVCTASDTHERRTIFDLLPPDFPRLFHVGRLDKESEGLLILTNDGALSLKLTHPRYKVEKEYEVVLDRPFDFAKVDRLLHGIHLEEGWAKAEAVHRLSASKLKVILRQGMKRQIRLMFYELGFEVVKLTRIRIGNLHLKDMPAAHWRALSKVEIESLLAHAEKTAAEPEEQPRPAPRQPSARIERAASERKPVASRPERRPFKPGRGAWRDQPGQPHSSEVEAIPFVPRAARGGNPAARPFSKSSNSAKGFKDHGYKTPGSRRDRAERGNRSGGSGRPKRSGY